MPLTKGSSPSAVAANISREVKAGRPQKQAAAIAMSTARTAAKKSGNMAKVKAMSQKDGGSERKHTSQRHDIGTGGHYGGGKY